MAEIVVGSGKTITVDELNLSRSGSSVTPGQETRVFTLGGSDNEIDIYEAIHSVAPLSTGRGLVFNGAALEPVVALGDNSIWTASCQYVSVSSSATGSRQLKVGTARLVASSTTEETQVVQPLEILSRTISDFAITEGDTPVPYQGIGDNGETFEGINVPKPAFGFKYDFNIPGLTFTPAYTALTYKAVGKLNSAPFKGFPEGTILCTGIDGTYATNEDTQLTFAFKWRDRVPEQWQPKLLEGQTANLLKVPEHSGWDVLDVHTITSIDPNVKRIFVDILQIDIFRVFESFDFNTLQIPGPNIG